MPNRNIEKIYLEDCYYHVYNRGVNKTDIFIDEEDYSVFLNLFKRYLSNKPTKDSKGREYTWMHDELELISYCLMPNHFHLLLYQKTPSAITALMRAVNSSYVTYFNKKYGRIGHLFQERFKASMITKDEYLMHITRYIHRNPVDYINYAYSSYEYFAGDKSASWINPSPIIELFSSKEEYRQFVKDYDKNNDELYEL